MRRVLRDSNKSHRAQSSERTCVVMRVVRARAAAAARAGRMSARRLSSAAAGGKAVATAEEAVKDIPSGAKLLVGGFGLTGVPENLLRAIDAGSAGDFTVVSSNVGTAEEGGCRRIHRAFAAFGSSS